MKIKNAADMTEADAKAYRKRRDDIGKGIKRVEGEIRDRLKKSGDLALELRKINGALVAYASCPPAPKGRASRTAPQAAASGPKGRASKSAP